MPKPTFFNLPEAKRERIVNAAIAEFATVPFDAASVNRIVRGAGIAKGSFYQYFEDMADVYRHLMLGVGAQRKMAAFLSHPPAPDLGLFGQFEHAMQVAVRWAMSEPLLAAASEGLRRHLPKNSPLRHFQVELQLLQTQGMVQMLEAGVQSGAVRPDVDVPAAAAMVMAMMQSGLDGLLQQRFGAGLVALCARGEPFSDEELTEIDAAIHQVVTLLQHAIGADPNAGDVHMEQWARLIEDVDK